MLRTFLFTDIKGSTELAERHPTQMDRCQVRHDELIATAVEANNGEVFKKLGDGTCSAFGAAPDAAMAAIDAERALLAEPWPDCAPIGVRMGVHTGTAVARGGDYYGRPLNRCARLMSAAHAGQILVSHDAAVAMQDAMPPGASLRSLKAHRLPDLLEPMHIYQLLHRDLPSRFPPIVTLELFAHNLPKLRDSFVGRHRDVEDLVSLLGGHPSWTADASIGGKPPAGGGPPVTLKGRGGIGKTRLAQHVAAEVIDAYPDGVWIVDFSGLSDSSDVEAHTLYVLGLSSRAEQSSVEAVIDYLEEKQALLVLDCCEHVLAGVARLAREVTLRCPTTRILATSRRKLDIPAEIVWDVPELAYPTDGPSDGGAGADVARLLTLPAVELFVDRACAANRRFEITSGNATDVAAVLRHVEGSPLAIELAASRCDVLSVREIRARLDKAIEFLKRQPMGDDDSRHLSLQATIGWSFDLLSGPAKKVFGRLSVFAGGWTLDACEQTCSGGGVKQSDIVDLLSELVRASIVEARIVDGDMRYYFTELIRQFAETTVSPHERRHAIGRHLAYFLRLAEGLAVADQESGRSTLADRLLRDPENLRAALTRSAERADCVRDGLRLAVAVAPIWELRGRMGEAREHLDLLLGSAGDDIRDHEVARALQTSGRLARHQGDYAEAKRLHEAALRIWRVLGDRRGEAEALNRLGGALASLGDYDEAMRCHRTALEMRRALDDRVGIGESTNDLAIVYFYTGDLKTAGDLLLESLDIREQLGNLMYVVDTRCNLAVVLATLGEWERARDMFAAALSEARSVDYRVGIAQALDNLAYLTYLAGDPAQARPLLQEALEEGRRLGDKARIANALTNLGLVELAEGNAGGSVDSHLESLAAFERIGERQGTAEVCCSLACAYRALGEFSTARRYACAGLSMALELGDAQLRAAGLDAAGRLALDAESHAQAVVFLAAAERVRTEGNYPRALPERERYSTDLRRLADEAPFDVDAAWQAATERDEDGVVAEAVDWLCVGFPAPSFDAGRQADSPA